MTRESYQHHIWVYKKRRKIYKEKYKQTSNIYYAGLRDNLSKRIARWNHQIRRIDERKKRIFFLRSMVNKYFDVLIQSKIIDAGHKLARSVYYKTGLESKMQGIALSKAIGHIGRWTASNNRKAFIKSFKGNEENRSIFYKFKEYFKSSDGG